MILSPAKGTYTYARGWLLFNCGAIINTFYLLITQIINIYILYYTSIGRREKNTDNILRDVANILSH